MPPQELLNFIKDAKNKGYINDEIRDALRVAGWKEDDIIKGFMQTQTPEAKPVTPPTPQPLSPQNTPKINVIAEPKPQEKPPTPLPVSTPQTPQSFTPPQTQNSGTPPYTASSQSTPLPKSTTPPASFRQVEGIINKPAGSDTAQKLAPEISSTPLMRPATPTIPSEPKSVGVQAQQPPIPSSPPATPIPITRPQGGIPPPPPQKMQMPSATFSSTPSFGPQTQNQNDASKASRAMPPFGSQQNVRPQTPNLTTLPGKQIPRTQEPLKKSGALKIIIILVLILLLGGLGTLGFFYKNSILGFFKSSSPTESSNSSTPPPAPQNNIPENTNTETQPPQDNTALPPTGGETEVLQGRDVKRFEDLVTIHNALALYFESQKKYPGTTGQDALASCTTQFDCYKKLTTLLRDAGLAIGELPHDPRTDISTYGTEGDYGYESNGTTYIVSAYLDNAQPQGYTPLTPPSYATKGTKCGLYFSKSYVYHSFCIAPESK